MGKPTEEELKTALATAAQMREQGMDDQHIAKALLNCHYRLGYAEKVCHLAQELIRNGMDATTHSRLVKAVDEYQLAETHPVLLK